MIAIGSLKHCEQMEHMTRAQRAARFTLVLIALLLPSLSLIPLGGAYLWKEGYLLHWALASAAVVAIVYAFERRLFARVNPTANAELTRIENIQRQSGWTATEKAAWQDVQRMAKGTDPSTLNDLEAIIDLSHRTINAVAKQFHPERPDALLQFTLTEALAINQRVSARLSDFLRDNVPFGDRLKASQVWQLYQWRNVSDYAERAYDIWRVVRLANPATAVTHEARERLSRAMMDWGKEQIARRLTETFVEEVGRAAIDLYGGRLPIGLRNAALDAPTSSSTESYLNAPLVIAVTGTSANDQRALHSLLRIMSETRKRAVLEHLIDEVPIPAMALHPSLELRDVDPSGDPADISLEGVGVVAVAFSGELTNCEGTILKLAQLDRGDRSQMPLLLLVCLEGSGGTNEGDKFGIVKALYPGPVLAPVSADLASLTIEDAGARLWQALNRAASDARRIQLKHALARKRDSTNWLGTAGQAVWAMGRLAKSAFPARRPDA